MVPIEPTPVIRLSDGTCVQLIKETEEGYLVRAWDFDEQWNMIPTRKTYVVGKEEYLNASSSV
jgi:hypothetical protein